MIKGASYKGTGLLHKIRAWIHKNNHDGKRRYLLSTKGPAHSIVNKPFKAYTGQQVIHKGLELHRQLFNEEPYSITAEYVERYHEILD